MKKALLIVDMQNDFCDNGTLAVPNANLIIPYINELLQGNYYQEIIFSQDWHPAGHKSFASNNQKNVGEVINLNGHSQVMWPDHCVQNSFGAAFHQELDIAKATHIVQKGKNPEVDSYSAFQDNDHQLKTDLNDYLQSKEIQLVEVVGLALDYCVKYTCIDAVDNGYITCLHFQGTKAVNIHPNDGKETIYQLLEKGVSILA